MQRTTTVYKCSLGILAGVSVERHSPRQVVEANDKETNLEEKPDVDDVAAAKSSGRKCWNL